MVKWLGSSQRDTNESWKELLGFPKKGDWVPWHETCRSSSSHSPFSHMDQDPWPCWDHEATPKIKPQVKNSNARRILGGLGWVYCGAAIPPLVCLQTSHSVKRIKTMICFSLCFKSLLLSSQYNAPIRMSYCLPKTMMLLTVIFNPGSAASLPFNTFSALLHLTHWCKLVTISISEFYVNSLKNKTGKK